MASRPDPLSTQKKPFSKGSQEAQAVRRHGEGRRDLGAGRGWHSRAAIRFPRGGLSSAVAPRRVSISTSGLGARWGQGAAGSTAGQQRAHAGQRRSQATCAQAGMLPGAPAKLASHQQRSGASWEPWQSRPDFKAGQCARWRLRVHTWLGQCRRLLCPARRPCPSGASRGQAQGAGTPRLTPAGWRERCQLGTRAAAPGGKSKTADGAWRSGRPCPHGGPPPAALRAGVHSPRFSSKEPEGERLANALPCQLSLKLVCRQPG